METWSTQVLGGCRPGQRRPPRTVAGGRMTRLQAHIPRANHHSPGAGPAVTCLLVHVLHVVACDNTSAGPGLEGSLACACPPCRCPCRHTAQFTEGLVKCWALRLTLFIAGRWPQMEGDSRGLMCHHHSRGPPCRTESRSRLLGDPPTSEGPGPRQAPER